MPANARDGDALPFAGPLGGMGRSLRLPAVLLCLAALVTAVAWRVDPAHVFPAGTTAFAVAFLVSVLHIRRRERILIASIQLAMAAHEGDAGKCRALLEAGAIPDALEHTCPLCDAAGGGFEETVRLLLEHGADPNRPHIDATPLFSAALRGHTGVVRALLDHGADPDRPGGLLLDDSGSPRSDPLRFFAGARPLHGAACGGHTEAVRLLLERGADPSLTTDEGATPLDHARRNRQEPAAALLASAGQA